MKLIEMQIHELAATYDVCAVTNQFDKTCVGEQDT